MKNSKILGFIAVMIILVVGLGLFAADFSDLYLGTAYKRLLVLRNDTTLTGLHATTPERVYDGEFTATPFSLSQEEILIFETLQLQFFDESQYIAATSNAALMIAATDEITLESTKVKSKGAFVPYADDTYDLGESSTPLEWKDLYIDGTAYLDAADIDSGTFDGTIGGTTPGAGAFTTISATGNVSFDGGTFIYNTSEADKDFRFAGSAQTNLLFGDAANARIGINTATPGSTLDIVGTLEVSGTSVFTGAITATGGINGTVGATTPAAGRFTVFEVLTSAELVLTNCTDVTTMEANLVMSGADIQMNSSNGIYFDADDDSGIESRADDEITFFIGGTAELVLTGSVLKPYADGGLSLGITGTYEFADIFTQDLHISDDLEVKDAVDVEGITTLKGALNAAAATVFNTGQADIDFTIKSDDNAIAFVVDASEDNVAFGASISYNKAQTFTDSDTTPSVTGYSHWRTNTTGATITDFDDGVEQQYLIIISKGAITYDVTGESLIGGADDIVTASGDVTHWLLIGTDWYLQTYIDQSDNLN